MTAKLIRKRYRKRRFGWWKQSLWICGYVKWANASNFAGNCAVSVRSFSGNAKNLRLGRLAKMKNKILERFGFIDLFLIIPGLSLVLKKGGSHLSLWITDRPATPHKNSKRNSVWITIPLCVWLTRSLRLKISNLKTKSIACLRLRLSSLSHHCLNHYNWSQFSKAEMFLKH